MKYHLSSDRVRFWRVPGSVQTRLRETPSCFQHVKIGGVQSLEASFQTLATVVVPKHTRCLANPALSKQWAGWDLNPQPPD